MKWKLLITLGLWGWNTVWWYYEVTYSIHTYMVKVTTLENPGIVREPVSAGPRARKYEWPSGRWGVGFSVAILDGHMVMASWPAAGPRADGLASGLLPIDPWPSWSAPAAGQGCVLRPLADHTGWLSPGAGPAGQPAPVSPG